MSTVLGQYDSFETIMENNDVIVLIAIMLGLFSIKCTRSFYDSLVLNVELKERYSTLSP